MTMHELPPTLTFQLKRFCQQPSTKRWYKNKSHISFPLDGLDLSAFSKQQQTKMAIEKNGEKTGSSFSYPQLYDLYSVIVHKGTLENGHYICYIRKKSQWYKCDDSIVMMTTKHEVLESEAYLLFYARRTIRQR
mmetsp:Transcript_33461/g.54364  ORF Transcript_33461/g.54364 Transcript_33461/m.54364 type:complete len:134 (+) Transcript_33461:493-894(+)